MRITLARDGQKYGPYSLDQVNTMLLSGKAAANDLAWIEGTPDWISLRTVPGVVAVPPPVDTRAHPDLPPPRELDPDASDRRILPAFLLAFFLGVFGVHRFYCGKTGSGIAMLVLTLTIIGAIVSGIWATIDWIMIVCGAFTDAEGRRLTRWT